MYHAQEKIINTPGAQTSGMRGGIHNSVTRTVLKPTHMIGGYAQQAWGFNYYGTVGSNRDEFVVLLTDLNQQGMTVVLVTHEADIAAWARRKLVFRDGQIVQDVVKAVA